MHDEDFQALLNNDEGHAYGRVGISVGTLLLIVLIVALLF